ncbi:DNA topoisomerase family protein [Thalassotalea atypica]|uniref:DNA topoisomerase family protein n=1 Tax=Thalassotalea atypica TaxID=2054316 RepID=UPI00257482C9|nr:topoisomerase DNA-binding C4 zinc finger domain-containing protein [Thalassotalea atypica]
MSNADKPLFSQHEHALEQAYGVCPDCGSELAIKNGKAGAFLGCQSYPTCQYTRPVVEHEQVDDKILLGSECPECGHELAVKQGRYGMFIGCSNFPDCHHIEDTNPKEDSGVACPECKNGELFEKTNRYGKTFYSCDRYPKCKYVINYAPVDQPCPVCHWPILVERKMASGLVLMCPQKKCNHKQKR